MSFSWPYRFVFSLSSDEIQHRRHVLDLRGYYAQTSALIVVGAISLYRHFRKESRTKETAKRSWWDSPPCQGWVETRKQYAIILLWLVWLLSLSIWNTGEDYMHFTKALAHVSLSQTPFQILLAPTSFLFTSNPALPSVLSALTSIPQTVLAPYHRLFGRLIIVPLLSGHAVLYLLFFVQVPHPAFGTVLAKRVRDLDVQYGLAGIVIALLILAFGRSTFWKLRGILNLNSAQARRRVFYVVHLVLVTALLALAYCHVVYARTFVLEAIGVSVANLVCCLILT